MKPAGPLSALALWMALVPAPANGCGVCLEDKVAATYDHAVVERAAARSLPVVFCEVIGPIDPDLVTAAARQVVGLERTTLRFSANPAALSFVLGEGGHTPESAAATLQGAAPPGTQIKVIKVMRKQREPRVPSGS